MSESKIDLDFADGRYTFALPLPRIDELQKKTGIGIGGLFARVLKGCVQLPDGRVVIVPDQGEFYVLDIVETLRQALIGGNHAVVDGQDIPVPPSLADRLIQNYVSPPARPLSDSWSLAASVLGACIVGYDPPKKAGPATKPAKGTATAD
jgi:tail tube GTA-gp10-like protein